MQWRLLFLGALLLPVVAQAGFLDNVLNKTKQTIENTANQAAQETVNKTVDSAVGNGTEAGSTGSSGAAPPAADSAAPGNVSTDKELVSKNGLPTNTALVLMGVHFNPEALDDDHVLKQSMSIIYPETRNWFNTDEFQWRKRKEEFRAKIRDRAKDVPTTYKVTPWPDGYNVPVIVLGKYDFDRNAFAASVRVRGWPLAGSQKPKWLRLAPDQAEKLVKSFGSSARWLYGGYTVTVRGVDYKFGKKDPSAVCPMGQTVSPCSGEWRKTIDKIDLYRLRGNSKNSADDFQYTTSLDTGSLGQAANK